VTNAWNSSVVSVVSLDGGTLSGGAITNDGLISGHGLVTSRVINNGTIAGGNTGVLIFETPGNNNDWDGAANNGIIDGVSVNIELRDAGAAFGFGGTVRPASGHSAFANGFALDFNPGSTLQLSRGESIARPAAPT
jgi:hypothetical protein